MATIVTGAGGHLGSVLVRLLLQRGETVRALIRREMSGLEGLDVERVRGDVHDPSSLRAAFDGATSLFHCAGVISMAGDPDGSVHRTNVDGVANVMTAARQAGVERVVHFSSVHAYDMTWDGGVIDEGAPRPGRDAPAYDYSKWRGEERVQDAVAAGLHAVIVNPTGVIGPGDYKESRLGRALRQMRAGTLPALVQGGFDFVDVRDVCLGAIAARDRGRPGENYILSGRWASVQELARQVHEVTGTPPPRLTAPGWLAAIGAPFVSLAARVLGHEPLYTTESLLALGHNPRVSCAKAEEELGYTRRALPETLADFFRWLDAGGEAWVAEP